MQRRDQRLHWVQRFVEFVSLKVPQRRREILREKWRGHGKVLFGRIEMWSCICSFLLISCLHVSFFPLFRESLDLKGLQRKEKKLKKGIQMKSVSIWVLPYLKCCINMCRYMHCMIMYILLTTSSFSAHQICVFLVKIRRRKIPWSHHASVKVLSSQGPRVFSLWTRDAHRSAVPDLVN